jgi:hypothetical protein
MLDDGLLIVYIFINTQASALRVDACAAGDQRVCGVEKGRYVSCSDGCQDSIRRAEFRTTFQGHSSMPQKYTQRALITEVTSWHGGGFLSLFSLRSSRSTELRRNTNDDYLNELSVSFIGQQTGFFKAANAHVCHFSPVNFYIKT